MNIFFLDTSYICSAQDACDQHIVKQTLENVQMLCTVLRWLGFDPPYKSTHENHPCVIWLKESPNNFQYLCNLTSYYNSEYRDRYEKVEDHKSWTCFIEYLISIGSIRAVQAAYTKKGIPFTYQEGMSELLLTRPPKCMPDEYKEPDREGLRRENPLYEYFDVIKSYRNYYLGEKLKFARYRNGEIPDFIKYHFEAREFEFPPGKLKDLLMARRIARIENNPRTN